MRKALAEAPISGFLFPLLYFVLFSSCCHVSNAFQLGSEVLAKESCCLSLDFISLWNPDISGWFINVHLPAFCHIHSGIMHLPLPARHRPIRDCRRLYLLLGQNALADAKRIFERQNDDSGSHYRDSQRQTRQTR